MFASPCGGPAPIQFVYIGAGPMAADKIDVTAIEPIGQNLPKGNRLTVSRCIGFYLSACNRFRKATTAIP